MFEKRAVSIFRFEVIMTKMLMCQKRVGIESGQEAQEDCHSAMRHGGKLESRLGHYKCRRLEQPYSEPREKGLIKRK